MCMLQLAPYNTTYERLAGHMAAAGVAASPNLWDTPVTLAAHHAHGHGHAHTAADSAESSVALATEHPPVQLLPPERLLPFMTPFVGGQGPLCGGPAAFASALSRCSPCSLFHWLLSQGHCRSTVNPICWAWLCATRAIALSCMHRHLIFISQQQA